MFTTSNVVILSHRLAFLVVFKGSHNRKYKMYGSGWLEQIFKCKCKVVFLCGLVYIFMHLIQEIVRISRQS